MFKPRNFTDTVAAALQFDVRDPRPDLVLIFDTRSSFWTTMDCNHIPHILQFAETPDLTVLARFTPGVIAAFMEHPCMENIAIGICDALDQRQNPAEMLDLIQIAADAPFDPITPPINGHVSRES